MSGRRIHVVAGVLFDSAGRVLVAQRQRGAHLGGLWEFPGGKLQPGESRWNGLVRELAEELAVRVLSARPLIWVEHRYPDRDIVLDVWTVESYSGEPHGREGQRVEWRDVRSLEVADLPPADAPVLTALRLPRRYLVTPEPGRNWSAFLDRLADRVNQGFDLIQLRARSLEVPALVELGRHAAEICRLGGAKLLVNAAPEVARRCGADGVHVTSRRLARLVPEMPTMDGDPPLASERTIATKYGSGAVTGRTPPLIPRLRAQSAHGMSTRREEWPAARRFESGRHPAPPESPGRDPGHAGVLAAATGQGSRMKGLRDAQEEPTFLIGASCHDADDFRLARAAGCDFAVLGPVRATPTHPGAPVLQWDGFTRLARGAGMPVFAIGGLGNGDIATALQSGGQGVAAIRGFWGED